MIKVSIIATRKVTEGKTNITFGVGKETKLPTLTGEVYDAEGLMALEEIPGSLPRKVDVSTTILSTTTTIIMDEVFRQKIEQATGEFFRKHPRLIDVGIILKGTGKRKEGINPKSGLASYSLLFTPMEFIGVELAERLGSMEDAIESGETARAVTKQQSKWSLASIANKLGAGITSLVQ